MVQDRPAEERREAVVIYDDRPRCWRCNKELTIRLTWPWYFDCLRCTTANKYP